MFQLDADLEAFRQEIRKTAERAFSAKAAYWDEKEEFPTENRDLAAVETREAHRKILGVAIGVLRVGTFGARVGFAARKRTSNS